MQCVSIVHGVLSYQIAIGSCVYHFTLLVICTTLSTFQKHTISATLQGMLRMLRCKRTTCSFDDTLESPTDSLFVFVVVVSLYGNILYLLKKAVVLDMHLEWS